MPDSSSLQFVLSQFRASYPGGSLTADLLQIHHESYVVRAAVQVAGTIVATGMASAASVEQAEDRARIRALEVLGILPLPMVPVASLSSASSALASSASASISSASSSASLMVPVVSSPKREIETDPDDRPPSPHLEASLPLPTDKTALAPKPSKPAPRSQNGRSANSGSLDEFPTTPDAGLSDAKNRPIDLSEIIDQTSVEMKRLGWTTEQGRQYLKQRFGKESRQQLSTDELEQFLDYLKLLI